jgi:Flp pilus assembly protein TadD
LGNFLLGIDGRAGEAIGHLERAVEIRPDWAAAHLALAGALVDIPGRRDEARKQLEEALRLQPGNSQARGLLESLSTSPP